MQSVIEKFESSIVIEKISWFIGSKIYPVIMGAYILLCYYLGWDMSMIWFMAISAIAMLLTCKDMTPVFALFLFMNIIISLQNSPSKLGNQSNYFVEPVIYIQIIVAISACIVVLLARLGYNIYSKTFRPSPMFFGICVLSITFLFNGAFAPEYTPLNIVYGLFLAAIYIGLFMLVSCNVPATKKTFESVAYYCCVFSVVLVIELTVAYATYDGLIVNGMVDRSKLFFGWGMYNTIGMLLCICIPGWFYLAITKKYGFLFTIGGFLNAAIIYFTFSRQSMLGAAIITVACVIWLLICVNAKERFKHLLIVVFVAAAVVVVVSLNFELIMSYLNPMIENIENGGNRIRLWQRAIEDFLKAPVFGVGFYYLKDLDAGFVGLDIIPLMYHNTVLQMLGACGIVGLIAYAFHRLQTIISCFKNITVGRIYVAITLGGLLFISLFDNHMFYIFPTIVYIAFVGLLQASESKKEQTAKTEKTNL